MERRKTAPVSIIEAPSGLGLGATGVDELPEALRGAGLLQGVRGVRQQGRVSVPPARPERDPASGVLNLEGIRSFSIELANAVASALDVGWFPLVLGGDCSILLGPTLELRRRGRFGLFFIDGHADFYSPESEPNGEVASMDLAVVTGREPRALADLEGRAPFVREEDVVVFGVRDAEEAVRNGSPDIRQTAMHVLELAEVRRIGAAAAVRKGLDALEANTLDGFWIHLDADALSDGIMPAVDYRMPDGLLPEEMIEVLAAVIASPLAVGMDVTIYNPTLDDPGRSAARVLAEVVTAGVTRSRLAAHGEP